MLQRQCLHSGGPSDTQRRSLQWVVVWLPLAKRMENTHCDLCRIPQNTELVNRDDEKYSVLKQTLS